MKAPPQPAPPNVLVIISDQHHPDFMGCAGHPLVQTPHLDRLAKSGTRFSRAFCNSPLCLPARMAFLTGRLPSEIDCLTNDRHLSSEIPTFVHAFGAAGYETILCGRMHFNGFDQRHGFQRRSIGECVEKYGPLGGLAPVLGELKNTTGPNACSIRMSGPGMSGYLQYDEAVAESALRELDGLSGRKTGQPFLMTVGFVQPHAPFVAPEDDYDFFDGKISTDDLPVSDPASLHPELRRLRALAGLEDPQTAPTLEQQRTARVAYHGMCRFLDRQIGKILGKLEEGPFRDNTVILYLSDHGEQLGEHGMWWKHTFYRGSVGVPMILKGPGLPKGVECSRNVSLMDMGPSLLDLCGLPGLPDVRGRSVRCLLEGRESEWNDEVIAENLWPSDSTCLHRMVVSGPWKMNHYPGFAPELFHMDQDPNECRDLVREGLQPGILGALEERLSQLENPESVLERVRKQRLVQPWIDRAVNQGDVPLPDAPWFSQRPRKTENWIAPPPRESAVRSPTLRFVLVGDSTVCAGGGWGGAFSELLVSGIECCNLALSGRSSKSFRDEGQWQKALDAMPDWVLIQFGHNDQPGKGPARETDAKTTYRENLERFITEARGMGAKPILVTSLTRRNFNAAGRINPKRLECFGDANAGTLRQDLLNDYVEVTRSVAAAQDVPLIDLNARSIAQMNELGPDAAAVFDIKSSDPEKSDKTHLSPEGATRIAHLVATEIRTIVPELAGIFLPQKL